MGENKGKERVEEGGMRQILKLYYCAKIKSI